MSSAHNREQDECFYPAAALHRVLGMAVNDPDQQFHLALDVRVAWERHTARARGVTIADGADHQESKTYNKRRGS